MSGDLQWNDAALYDLLHSIDGPVGRWLQEKMLQMTAAVEADAPIQKPKNYSWGRDSTSYEPRSEGYLKGSVRPHMGYTKSGNLFAGRQRGVRPDAFPGAARPSSFTRKDSLHEQRSVRCSHRVRGSSQCRA